MRGSWLPGPDVADAVMCLHQDFAALVVRAAKQPVDENAPGTLCRLSSKSSMQAGRDAAALYETRALAGRCEVRIQPLVVALLSFQPLSLRR
jgi:hypothetical protein